MKKHFYSDFRNASVNAFGNYANTCFKIPEYLNFNFVEEKDYKKLNKMYKGKYASYQFGFLSVEPMVSKFGKIKKFTKDGDVILKNRKRFSTRFIFNISDDEDEARLLCEVWE